jgi:hypothetical protein
MLSVSLTALCGSCQEKDGCRGVTSFHEGMGCVKFPCCFRCPFPDCKCDKEGFYSKKGLTAYPPRVMVRP